eukprot:scaffold8668_cov13-Tisochrysis_lutea.AAC.1
MCLLSLIDVASALTAYVVCLFSFMAAWDNVKKEEKEKPMLAERPSTFRKGSLTSKLPREKA